MFKNWLRRLLKQGWKQRPSTTAHRLVRLSAPLRVEQLEDRCVPSTFAVTRADDNVAAKGTLGYAVANAASGDSILIAADLKNTPIVLTQGELLLNQNVTIKGVGNIPETISGGGLSRVFEIAAGANVTLSNLCITSGAGDPSDPTGGNGGAILNDGSLALNGCRLTGNGADSQSYTGYVLKGGAIANQGTLAASNCTIEDNSAFDGGGIYSTGSVALNSCKLTGNAAISYSVSFGSDYFTFSGDGGAMVSRGGTATLDGCTVSGNSAPMTAGSSASAQNTGGIDSTGNLAVSDSAISGNSGRTTGGINNSGILAISDSTVSANAGTIGGVGGNGAVTSDNSSFSANGSDFAGALTATNSAFTGDFVQAGTGTVSDCTFTNATIGGGGRNRYRSPLTVSHCDFTGGSGVDNRGQMTVTDCNFTRDTAGVTNHGFMAVTNCNFTNSPGIANLSGNGGYAMTVSDSAFTGSVLYNVGSILVTDCTFTACVGAVRNYDYMKLDDSTLYGNCNAIVNYELGESNLVSRLEVNNCNISGNSGDYGAAIQNDNFTPPANTLQPTVIVNDCTLSSNSASVDGGGIYNYGGILMVSGSILSDNTAGRDGGAIYNIIYFLAPYYPPAVTITNSILSGNTAGVSGGAIFVDIDASVPNPVMLTVTGCTLSKNSAGMDGGAIYNNGAPMLVSGSTLSGNTASGDGGGIFNNGGVVNLANSIFFLNTPDNIVGGFTDLGGNSFS
jgi:predicted outer membrane repeat protein